MDCERQFTVMQIQRLLRPVKWKNKNKKKKTTKKKTGIYLHFFLNHFCVLIVKFRCKMCKKRGIEKLLTNLFGHNVKQPSPWLADVNRPLRWPVKTFVYYWRRLM